MMRDGWKKRITLAVIAVVPTLPAFASDTGEAIYNGIHGLNSPPGTPDQVQIRITSPTSLVIQFRNTATTSECVKYEFSTWINGQPVGPPNNPATPYAGGCLSGQLVQRPLGNLQPETEYCFEVWSRRNNPDVRSERPSARVCGRTPAFPPGAPLAVAAATTSAAGSAPPRVTWSAPDVSNHRPVVVFRVERMLGGDWVKEADVQGPSYDTSLATRRDFAYTAKWMDHSVKQFFRVCSVNNDNAPVCSPQVALQVKTVPVATPGTSVNDTYATAAAVSNQSGLAQLSPQARQALIAATASNSPARTSQTTSRPATPPAASAPPNGTFPSALTAQQKVDAAEAILKPSSGSGNGMGSGGGGGGGGKSSVAAVAAAAPASADIASLVRTADLPPHLATLTDSAIIIVGGKSLRAADVKQAVLALDDRVPIRVAGQVQPAAALRREIQQARAGVGGANWAQVPQATGGAAAQGAPLGAPGPASMSPNSGIGKAPGSALPQ